jgi:UDP-galactose transporter
MSSLLSAKNVSLLALVLQQAALVLMIRHSQTAGDNTYIISAAVVTAEVVKMVLNWSLELTVGEGRTTSMFSDLFSTESIKLTVPALLYVIQNNLLFVALGNLSVPIYQVTNQGKLLTTAVFSRILLGKEITYKQYFSLFVLAAGVAIVHFSSTEQKITQGATEEQSQQNHLLGLAAVFFSCCTSGFAGVYFEKVLKSSPKISVYMRNCQLGVWSILLGVVPVLVQDLDVIQQRGWFTGYNAIVVGVIMCQAGTGLIVALVMKYADTILKGFATSFAVVLATILSIFIFDATLDWQFGVGASMVIWAVQLYSSDKDFTIWFPKNVFQFFLSQLKIQRCFVILSVWGLFTSFYLRTKIRDMQQQQIHNELTLIPKAKRLTKKCTQEASIWSQPNGITSHKYQTILQAEEILRFIVAKLDEINAPITLMYGTALHEFRNGTDIPCLLPNYRDKDFDISVFPVHYDYINTFRNEIMETFGWEYSSNREQKERLFTSIQPANSVRDFQIDVYGFFCNETNDHIFFPWDNVTIAKSAFLPLRKHKLILPRNDTGTNADNGTSHSPETPGFHMPNDPNCMLHNIYGSDYMTPKSGKSSQAKWGTQHGKPAYDNPKCNSTLTTFEEHELERQLGFCSGVVSNY